MFKTIFSFIFHAIFFFVAQIFNKWICFMLNFMCDELGTRTFFNQMVNKENFTCYVFKLNVKNIYKCKSWISQTVLPLYRPAPSQTCESEVCLMALTWLLCSCGALRTVWTAGCRWRRDKTWLRCSTDPPWLRISSGGLSSARLARTCRDAAKTQRDQRGSRNTGVTFSRAEQ